MLQRKEGFYSKGTRSSRGGGVDRPRFTGPVSGTTASILVIEAAKKKVRSSHMQTRLHRGATKKWGWKKVPATATSKEKRLQ